MTIYRVSPGGTGTTGADWANAVSDAYLHSTLAAQLGAGDAVLVAAQDGGKAYFEIQPVRFTPNFSGTPEKHCQIKIGGSIAPHDVSQHGPISTTIRIGDNPFPWRPADGEGNWDFWEIQGDYVDLIGFCSYHTRFGVMLTGSHNVLSDYSIFSVHNGLEVYGTDNEIVGLQAKYARKNVVRLRDGAHRTTIRQFAIDGASLHGSEYPNGIVVEAATDCVIRDGYISDINYTATTDNYHQGDAITANNGSDGLKVKNVHVKGMTDRGIDSKAHYTCIIQSSVDSAKHGVCLWKDTDNIILGSTIRNPRASRNEGSCLQVVGKMSVVYSHLIGSGLVSQPSGERGAVMLFESATASTPTVNMVGGSIETNGSNLAYFKHIGASATLKNVVVNGQMFSGTYTYDGTNSRVWDPIPG